MSAVKLIAGFLVAASLIINTAANADNIPLIDAHSQLPSPETAANVIELMDKAGISKVILSFRGAGRANHVIKLGIKHPDRIIPSIKTKGINYIEGTEKFYSTLAGHLKSPAFGAMAETILWHAKKGNKAPEQIVDIMSKQVQTSLKAALKKGWPFIIHIEFAAARAAGDGERFMTMLDGLLKAYPDHPFPMIHMGQLQAKEVAALIGKYPNIYFITSHSNPVIAGKSGPPWVDMFIDDVLAPEWKKMMIEHPDRFIFGIDNVWPQHWGDIYIEQVNYWRNALAELPHEVAHMIGHRNAERLWGLNNK